MWDPRRWPWWGWVIVVVCTVLGVLFSGGVAYRQASLQALHATISEIRTAGRPALPADIFALAPSVDQDRQERLWRVVTDTSGGWWRLQGTGGMEGRFDRSRSPGKLALDSEAMLHGSAANREQWRALHREGPVIISGFGWLRRDVSDPTTIGLERAAATRIPNLLSLRGLGNALATESRLAEDPLHALRDLEALVQAMEKPVSLIDAMIVIAIQSIRDSTWLEATLRGVDPDPWVDLMPRPLEQIADGFAGERALFNGGLAQDALNQSGVGSRWGDSNVLSSAISFSVSNTSWSQVKSWFQGKLLWFTCPSDARFLLQYNLLTEDVCRTGIDRTGPLFARLSEPIYGFFHPISGIVVANGSVIAQSGAKAEISDRMYRIAACAVRQWYTTGELPAAEAWNQPQAQRLLAAFPLTPALQYQRLSATRFRIALDPAAPTTALVPAAAAAPTAKFKSPWSTGAHWLELDLAGIPRP